MKKTIAVGMSGGVDSSLAAKLLLMQGHNVIGITMKHWHNSENDKSKSCCSIEDVYDAKRVCDDLNIPHYTVNFEKEFKKDVISYFISEYVSGKTPNPCVVCNRKIKLGKLVDFAMKIGADYFATGHYSAIEDGKLKKSIDKIKDQSYFLAQVKKEYFNKLVFPLGGYTKDEVRELAKEHNIRVYSKRDSQEICFIENDDYKSFLKNNTNQNFNKGKFKTIKGEDLGEHKGFAFYTIGQRKGLGISYKTPLYVISFDAKRNEIILGDNKNLFKNKLICKQLNFFYDNIEKMFLEGKIFVKTRSRDKLNECKNVVLNNDQLEIEFVEAVRAITPGQLAVLYNESGYVLGSGYIV